MFVDHNSFSAMESYLLHRSPDPRIRPSFAFIEANLHQRIRLSDLARQSGLSTARYSHLFALSTGMTPGKYIRSLRSRQAAKLVS
jgi:AraC-like DNA-binding protein